MKKFEKPVMEVEMLEVTDIITTSTLGGCTADCPADGCPNLTPCAAD